MRSIFIATPSYGTPVSAYYGSILRTIPLLEAAGHRVRWLEFELCCYVHTARNRLAAEFLLSGMDDLLFIDNDIGWTAEEMVKLCARKLDIVGAAAPFRHGAGGFPTHPLQDADGNFIVDEASGLVEVDVLPTAVMKINRAVLTRMGLAGLAPLRLLYDAVGKESGRYLSFFDFEADEKHHVEFGEDVSFCRKCRRIEKKLLVDPDITLSHFGPSFRSGKLRDHLESVGRTAPAQQSAA